MSNIFLDCGSNLGRGYTKLAAHFNIKDTKHEVHMFEPNIVCYKQLQERFSGFTIHNKAVWNKNEKRILNIEWCPNENGLVGGATNIIQDNFIMPGYIKEEYMHEWPPKYKEEVECIDLSLYIKEHCKKEDKIILKLDIEGAELEVLDKLIEDSTIDYLNACVVEWHFHMRKHFLKPKDYYLNIFKEKNIHYLEWH